MYEVCGAAVAIEAIRCQVVRQQTFDEKNVQQKRGNFVKLLDHLRLESRTAVFEIVSRVDRAFPALVLLRNEIAR